MNEQITKLAELFKQREKIEREIISIIESKPVLGGGNVCEKERIAKPRKVVLKKHKNGGRECCECGDNVPKGKFYSKKMCNKCYYKNFRSGKLKAARKETIYSYECIDCLKQFRSPLDIDNVKCPVSPDHKIIQK